MQEALKQSLISEGHARPILMLSGNEEEQNNLYRRIVDRKLTVREAERISRHISRENTKKMDELIDQETRIIEEKLSDTLGTKVQIEKSGEKGKIHIDFFSEEELRAFLDKMALLRGGKVKEIEVEETVTETVEGPNNTANIAESMGMGEESQDTGFEGNVKPIYRETVIETTEELPTSEIEQPEEDDFLKSFTI